MTGLGKRLAALEARTPVGCPICRRWDGLVLADDAGTHSRPERCPGCGRLVPVRCVVVVVGVPLEAV